jgi:site-specific DNA-methyltransferase (adenine-specific)
VPSSSFFVTVAASSKSDNWPTPPAFFDTLNKEFAFTLDPAASAANAKCKRYFSKKDDGLTQDWGTETVFCNPPYGRGMTGQWVQKAYTACLAGAVVVVLVPARTDTRWWHDVAMKGEIHFVRGRLRFGNGSSPAPFPSAVIVFRPPRMRRRRAA